MNIPLRLGLSAAITLAACAAPAGPAAAHADPGAKKVAILIFDNVEVIDYSGPLEVLSDAGFDVFTVAATKDPVTTSAGDAVKLTAKYTFADAPQADLIVIPGGGFEAAKDSATVAWIKRESEHAAHTMSVCNGAFTLANTGLLDGLSATTTAGNINRFRRTYPNIKVAADQRVVDNGRILTTAGLSAGIDGALHMVDIMKGEGAGRSVALDIEYDWRPEGAYVRGVMADRMIPSVYAALNAQGVVDPFDSLNLGGNDHWERTLWYATPLAPGGFFDLLKDALAKGYAANSAAWDAKTVHLDPAGPLKATLRFKDQKGQSWQGTVSVAAEKEGGQLAWRLVIDRAGHGETSVAPAKP
jgi:putative intracellular protease/amidase